MSRKAAGPLRVRTRQSCGCDLPGAVPEQCRGETFGRLVGVGAARIGAGIGHRVRTLRGCRPHTSSVSTSRRALAKSWRR
jgi:hypothetical protein